MEKQNRLVSVIAGSGMLVLIFDGKTALTGVSDGITLCLTTLIPSIFPYLLLSILLTGTLTGQIFPALQWIASACKMPPGTESILAVSFLGGYPVGAQNVALLYQKGRLTLSQSVHMLGFCNNAGPAFIFGVLGSMFSNSFIPWVLWIILILSSICVGYLFPSTIPITAAQPLVHNIRITDAIAQAVRTMALICGWVVFMRMILSFLDSWFLWLFPEPVQVILSGILELSNGCIRLTNVESEGLRFVIAAGLLAFGGICVTLQTASVAESIPMKQYFCEKILQSCISIALSCLLQFIFPADSRFIFSVPVLGFSFVIALIVLFAQYSKNSSGIPSTIGV